MNKIALAVSSIVAPIVVPVVASSIVVVVAPSVSAQYAALVLAYQAAQAEVIAQMEMDAIASADTSACLLHNLFEAREAGMKRADSESPMRLVNEDGKLAWANNPATGKSFGASIGKYGSMIDRLLENKVSLRVDGEWITKAKLQELASPFSKVIASSAPRGVAPSAPRGVAPLVVNAPTVSDIEQGDNVAITTALVQRVLACLASDAGESLRNAFALDISHLAAMCGSLHPTIGEKPVAPVTVTAPRKTATSAVVSL